MPVLKRKLQRPPSREFAQISRAERLKFTQKSAHDTPFTGPASQNANLEKNPQISNWICQKMPAEMVKTSQFCCPLHFERPPSCELGDHQTESCLREVVSYKCLKFRNGWQDASSYWLLRKTCFCGGISLPAQISCLRGRHFERSRYKVFQLNIGCSEMVCLCMRLPF